MRHAEVAQLAEQLIRNQQIVGSSPIFSSIFAAILYSYIVPGLGDAGDLSYGEKE